MNDSEIREASTSTLIKRLVGLGVILKNSDEVMFSLRRSEDGDLAERICLEIDLRIPIRTIAAAITAANPLAVKK